MSSIDERVVQMKFNNSQFSQGIRQTNAELDSLKKGLNLDASAKSLQGLDAAGKKFSLAGMATGVENISAKFTAMGVVGVTALANIANKAVNTATTMAKALTIDPVMAGFSEYELKLGSIQTILANTSIHGTTLEEVTANLDELNAYADKTIYNFGDMTKNIGLFTNAGIKIEDATSMIKGFSNEAASSGTNAQQAAGAAYQLSQALSKGKITLEDWKSLTNAGMGSANMKQGIIDIAEAMGTLGTAGVSATDINKDFNGSLEKGWMTADVMQNYLKIQAGELGAEQMKTLGLSEDQIAHFQKQQVIAEEAATKVRTYTQLWGVLQEAVGSSWAVTWETLLGDFNEATELWTAVNDALTPMITAAGVARNKMLTDWKDLGGRTAGIDAVKGAFEALMAIFIPIKEAFGEIFPSTTGAQLYAITVAIRDFALGLKIGAETSENLKSTFKGVFAVLDIGWMIIKQVVGVIFDLIGAISGGGGSVLAFTGNIGDFLVSIRNAIKEGTGLTTFFDILSKVLRAPIDLITSFAGKIGSLFSDLDFSALDGVAERLTERFSPLTSLGDLLGNVWGWVIEMFSSAMTVIEPVVAKIGDFLSDFGSSMTDTMSNIDFSAVLDGINTGLFAGLILLVRKFFKGGFKDEAEEGGTGLVDTIKEMFGGVTETLKTMQTQLKAKTLLSIAGAVALLAVSVVALSMIDSAKLGTALAGLSVMLIQLVGAMTILDMISTSTGFIKLPFITAALIPLAAALVILAAAVKMMSSLDWNGLAKGLTGVAVLLGLLAGAAKLLSANKGGLISAGIGMIAIAAAIRILVGAVEDFSDMDWEELGRGLAGLGATLTALAIFTRIAKTGKGAMTSAVGLILLAAALKVMASALNDFTGFNWEEMGRGFAGLGGALVAVAVGMRLMPKNMVMQAAALAILGGSLKIMASAMKDFAGMEWDSIGRGLTAMGGALLIVAIGMQAMPKNMLVSAAALVVVAGALKIVHSVLEDMGGMSWEEIGKGLVVLAASLIIIAGALYLMTAAIPGSLALIVAAGALAILTPVLIALSGMTWGEIAAGLTMLAASLLIIAVGGIALILALPGLIGLGIAALAIGAGTLLAGIGLTAMSIALTALAISLPLATAGIVGLVQGILGLIPYALEQLALGIAIFVQTIADNGPVFLNAMITLILMLLQGINTVAPQIAQTLLGLILTLLNLLAQYVPQFVTSGMNLLIGILTGIANNIGRLVTAATDVIVAFINGIANNLPRIIDSGMNLIVSFVQGVADGIRNNQSAMDIAGRDLGWAVADGMTGGLASKIPELAKKAAEMAGAALQAAKDFLNINSPSKKFIEVGKSTGEGFVMGIDSYTSKVENSATAMGGSAVDSIRNAINGVSDYLDLDMEMNPTITPILDLTNIEKGSASINRMIMAEKDLMLHGNVSRANHVSDATERARLNSIDNPAQRISAEAPVKLEYVQNNYSPKALSSIEIYRQTNNQISTVKGYVGAKK